MELDDIQNDIQELKDWAARHDDSHTADTKLLASILDSLSTHEHNHHGLRTTLTRGGGIAAGVSAILIVLAEVLTRLIL
ncbi:hypothetical protein LCGC14_0581750 [marine sediment metagenome]|uniref:Uncharacterized protein n=1 Tax=marine sediment metagenome TaxID=412755 RepID=A0A0F9RG81_9ZZZZ